MEATEEQTAPIRAATSYISTSLHEPVKLRLAKQGQKTTFNPDTLPRFFQKSCEKYADRYALAYRPAHNVNDSDWIKVTYTEYAKNVEQVALMLLHVGLQPRSSVGILAHNCPEWFYAEFATFKAGAVIAGIYPSSSPEAVAHVLDSSDATICIVDTAEQMAKVRAVKKRLPRLRAVIQLQAPFEEYISSSEQGYYQWDHLMAMEYSAELKEELVRRENEVYANECALLIFTSGTTGMPKAAMLSHDSLLFNCKAFAEAMNFSQAEERIVSYLPLNHVAAQLFDIFISLLNGFCVWFADRNAIKGSLFNTYQEVRPTFVFGVPRIFEKLQEGIIRSDLNLSPFAKCITERARRTVEQYYMDQMNKKPPSRFKYWMATKVTNQIKYALGLECCKGLYVGGAPTSVELKRFFLSIDLPLVELFGMTESSGGISVCGNEIGNLQNVGKALEGIELKIDNPDCNGHGEICFRGRVVFMGYLNEIEKTKETIKEDGFCFSGDLGYLDTDGYLYVSGRIKELIVTAGGENIPPVYIEDCIKRELNAISNAIVVGDRRKFLTVLLTLKTEVDPATGLPKDTLRAETKEWLQSLGIEVTCLSELLNLPQQITESEAINTPIQLNAKVQESIECAIKRVNNHALSNAQKVQKFAILPHDLSVVTGEIGPTMKICRHVVLKKYAKIVDRLYQ